MRVPVPDVPDNRWTPTARIARQERCHGYTCPKGEKRHAADEGTGGTPPRRRMDTPTLPRKPQQQREERQQRYDANTAEHAKSRTRHIQRRLPVEGSILQRRHLTAQLTGRAGLSCRRGQAQRLVRRPHGCETVQSAGPRTGNRWMKLLTSAAAPLGSFIATGNSIVTPSSGGSPTSHGGALS